MRLAAETPAAVGLALLLAGCQFRAAEPKQREDWALAPVQYGEVRYEGLRAPSPARPKAPVREPRIPSQEGEEPALPHLEDAGR
jgi:hypothetical protein